jgi:transglutaminase-like putative cysteine protease
MKNSAGGVAHDAIDWSRVAAATYRVEQSIRYDYASPISRLQHKLVISPRTAHGDQRRISHDLHVSPNAPSRASRDEFGNHVVSVEVPRVESSIAFVLTSNVVRDARLGKHHVLASSSAGLGVPCERRRLIRPDEALFDIGADLRARHRDDEELAHAISAFVSREMIYTKGVTDVFTTAAVAFSMRRGVCQDYAHIAIAISRVCGLPARYVSGHLLGEGATHAWVEFLVPASREGDRARVISLDPTNRCATNLRYIVVAIGRDYDDVAPTSGCFVGKTSSKIDSRQSVRITDVTYAA